MIYLLFTMTEQELWLYRKLFLKRYSELVKRTQELYKLTPLQVQTLQEKVLNIDWCESAIQKIPSAHPTKDYT